MRVYIYIYIVVCTRMNNSICAHPHALYLHSLVSSSGRIVLHSSFIIIPSLLYSTHIYIYLCIYVRSHQRGRAHWTEFSLRFNSRSSQLLTKPSLVINWVHPFLDRELYACQSLSPWWIIDDGRSSVCSICRTTVFVAENCLEKKFIAQWNIEIV